MAKVRKLKASKLEVEQLAKLISEKVNQSPQKAATILTAWLKGKQSQTKKKQAA